ncbi:MAG: sigma 54-interacting transcriptional regulator [Desulfuromonadales bacterium]|nr:sigma 54-interacting transcriptional regulator [Desulfuromonadales bacterium]
MQKRCAGDPLSPVLSGQNYHASTMNITLRDIQDTVIQYAEIIAQVINVDVEIVDHEFIRLAGTGFYRNRLNESMANEGFVFQAALESGQTQVIKDPGRNRICISCPKQLVCAEKLEICKPIKLGEETIGVIGLICFFDEQRQRVLDNFDAYLAFLDKIAEFIASKAYEKLEKRRSEQMVGLMNQVIDKINSCVIILNREDCISYINQNAIKQLDLRGDCLGRPVSITATGDSILDNEEFNILIDQQRFLLAGNLFPVDLGLEGYAKILIFREMKTFTSRIYELTKTGASIGLDQILGDSPAILELKRQIVKIAHSTSTVLIRGESGTGKEMVARAIFHQSDRCDEPFVAINCGAIPDTLLESELFGYVKGAFTGADPKGKIGKFELANKGILFLDEIGDMPLYLQVKMLRVLEEKKITRIGSNNPINIDIRIIAATHKNLSEMIHEHNFREDLFYRLNVIPIDIPPLRERKADIEILTRFFIAKYTGLFSKHFHQLDPAVLTILQAYDWPGNIRELENSIEFMINMMNSDGLLSCELLPKSLVGPSFETTTAPARIRPLRELESEAISAALTRCGTTTLGKRLAAQQLGIGIATLYRKIESLGLSK